MEGLKVGRLLVGKKTTRAGRAAYECTCDCGGIKVVARTHLRSGAIRSCGCLHSEVTAKRNSSHGLSKTPTYRIWAAMVSRCHNPNHYGYAMYGGRGIAVCDRWRHDFLAFLSDMGERPQGLSIDRIDNSKGYEPGNCRWATSKEQGQNTRRCKLTMEKALAIRADPRPHKEIAADYGICYGYVSQIQRGRVWQSSDQGEK